MRHFTILFLFALLVTLLSASVAYADCETSTQVRGHCQQDRFDQDNNGIPDEGITVNGHYTLNQAGCDYVVNYRGNFENTPYLDSGWIMNIINCDDGTQYQYLIVHESDPRYTGNPYWSVWDTWEYHTLVIAGQGAEGNLVRPYHN